MSEAIAQTVRTITAICRKWEQLSPGSSRPARFSLRLVLRHTDCAVASVQLPTYRPQIVSKRRQVSTSEADPCWQETEFKLSYSNGRSMTYRLLCSKYLKTTTNVFTTVLYAR